MTLKLEFKFIIYTLQKMYIICLDNCYSKS